jgi:hypothetical protein
MKRESAMDGIFKICNKCGFQWETWEAFLSDKSLNAIGYQVFFEDLKTGMFLFNHSCNTTIAMEAELFLDLYDGPFYTERKNNASRKCPGRCMNENIMNPCSNECRCAFVRELMRIINHRKEDKTP